MEIYKDEETKKRVKESEHFSASFPFEAAITDGMEKLTLEQLGQKLIEQFSEKGAVGVKLIEVRFSVILDS